MRFPAPLPMNFALGLALLAITSCTLMEKGAPTAAMTIPADSADDVEAAVSDVFRAAGYTVSQRTNSGVVFERPASTTDEVLYGNWNESEPLIDRVQVTVALAGVGSYRVSCFPFAVRGGSDDSFQDAQRRVHLFSPHYNGLLREVRKALQ